MPALCQGGPRRTSSNLCLRISLRHGVSRVRGAGHGVADHAVRRGVLPRVQPDEHFVHGHAVVGPGDDCDGEAVGCLAKVGGGDVEVKARF